jgi:hypothetical protein
MYSATPPAVRKVSVSGGATTTLAIEGQSVSPQNCYWRIVLEGGNVYWSSGGTSGPVSCATKKVSLNGGAITTLIDYPFLGDFTADDSYAHFSEFRSNSPTIFKLPVNGGASTVVATNAAAWVMTNFGSRLSWIDLGRDTFGWIDKSAVNGLGTCIPEELLIDRLSAAEGIAVDSSGLYVTETQTGTIYSVQ